MYCGIYSLIWADSLVEPFVDLYTPSASKLTSDGNLSVINNKHERLHHGRLFGPLFQRIHNSDETCCCFKTTGTVPGDYLIYKNTSYYIVRKIELDNLTQDN